jgi:hypothetical protein
LRYVELWSRSQYERGADKRREASNGILNDIL